MNTICKNCNCGLFTLKALLLDHVVGDLRVFETHSVLIASTFEEHNVIIKQAYQQTSRRSDIGTKESLSRVECELEEATFAIINHILETNNKWESSRKEQILLDGAFLVSDGKKIAMPRNSFLLTRCTILDEALNFVRKLFTIFGKHTLQTFETLMREVLTESGFNDRKSRTTLHFVRSEHVVGGYVPSLYNYDKKWCCILDPNVLPFFLMIFEACDFDPNKTLCIDFFFECTGAEKTNL